ncbi:MAG: glycosyltransferase [Pseudobutyrivibrio sp.]|nr:glycosyltransferase [Pseudobutyrivibrio sp.]
MKRFNELESQFSGRRVLYITTKNIDYIRVSQEINFLNSVAASVRVIGSSSSSYPKRLAQVFKDLFFLKLTEFDIVFVGFAPQLIMPFFGRKLSKLPVVMDFFISVYDTMVLDRKKFADGGMMSGFCHRLDERTLKRADYIVCDTMAHGRFFAEELGANPEKLRVLYLEADHSIYYPRKASTVSENNGQAPNAAPHKVLYFGSILNLQGVDIILDALRNFAGDDRFQFEIIGPIKSEMNKPIQANITYIDWLSQQDLAEHIAAADLCLAGHFSGTIEKARRTIPGKAYIYEAMGRPMILGDGDANHELFKEDDTHRFVEMGNASALATAIRVFFES